MTFTPQYPVLRLVFSLPHCCYWRCLLEKFTSLFSKSFPSSCWPGKAKSRYKDMMDYPHHHHHRRTSSPSGGKRKARSPQGISSLRPVRVQESHPQRGILSYLTADFPSPFSQFLLLGLSLRPSTRLVYTKTNIRNQPSNPPSWSKNQPTNSAPRISSPRSSKSPEYVLRLRRRLLLRSRVGVVGRRIQNSWNSCPRDEMGYLKAYLEFLVASIDDG